MFHVSVNGTVFAGKFHKNYFKVSLNFAAERTLSSLLQLASGSNLTLHFENLKQLESTELNKICGFTVEFMKLAYMSRPVKIFQTKDQ